MPCQGPDRRSPEQIQEITQKVLEYLANHHGVFGPVPGQFFYARHKENWDKEVEALKRAIDELCWTQSCLDF